MPGHDLFPICFSEVRVIQHVQTEVTSLWAKVYTVSCFIQRNRFPVRTLGPEPLRMKDILDEGGDFYNLHKLVFHDLDPEMWRDEHAIKRGVEVAMRMHLNIL